MQVDKKVIPIRRVNIQKEIIYLNNYNKPITYALIISVALNTLMLLLILKNSSLYFSKEIVEVVKQTIELVFTKATIEIVAILTTLFFGLLVWKATQKSADFAEQSVILSKNIMEMQKQNKLKIRNEYLGIISNQTYEAFNVIREIKEDGKDMLYRINDVPTNHSLSPEQLGSSFTQSELDMIWPTWHKIKVLKQIAKEGESYEGELDSYLESAYNEFQDLTDYLGNGRLHYDYSEEKI